MILQDFSIVLDNSSQVTLLALFMRRLSFYLNASALNILVHQLFFFQLALLAVFGVMVSAESL